MNPIDIIERHFEKDSFGYKIIVTHSSLVVDKAVKIAKKLFYLNCDINFIKEAAMLHDIGTYLVNAPKIGCFGKELYITHGYLGRKILDNQNLPKHALVCERHVGVGLCAEYIKEKKLPLPIRDMLPVSLEEQIISYSDKFFSKSKNLFLEASLEEVRAEIARFGSNDLKRFDKWHEIFGGA
ncbi:MAG: HD domain-containing protein [Deltaproteobacteria bacterium]|nr:HD domain-containing protein [Deltaproteobacteria bacterium]